MSNNISSNQSVMNNSNGIMTLSHETGIILSKQSSENEIKRYFKSVLELSKSDNEYPINLDEVWMLVYSEKGKAVRALKENFIDGVDYNTFAKNGKTATGGYKVIEYRLTVSCMEFFIARKVRPVFEVYRQVFHHAINHSFSIPQTYSDALLLAANQAKRIESLEAENHQLLLERNSYLEKVEFADSIMQSKNCITIGEMANILNQNKIFRKGRNALYGALRQKGYLLKRGIRYNLPTQKSISEGIMRVAEIPSHTISGITINRSAVITPKGQQYFIKMFRKLKGDKQFSLSF